MKINKQFILDYLNFKVSRPMKIRELSNEMRIDSEDYGHFRELINALIKEGNLVKLRRGRIGVPSEMNIVIGNIAISRGGFGKITTDSGEIIGIDTSHLHTALDGDKVMVRISENEIKGKYGTVARVVERAGKNIIGLFQKRKNFNYVVPDYKRFRRDIIIPPRWCRKAVDGDRVVVNITEWEEPNLNPEGKVIEVLGDPEKPGVDIRTVIKRYDLPEEFPAKIVKEVDLITPDILQREFNRRKKFTNEMVYTIDPSDAKDHDDAISVAKTKTGFQLGVYIADVSFYIREKSLLDSEALRRGNSVYLPGHVIPMLPEKLSNDLCSLKPNRRRLVMAVIIDLDHNGVITKSKIMEGSITSQAKLSYEEVQHFFDTGKKSSRLEKVAGSLKLARQLGQILQKNRMKDGSLDFDLPEARIVMNKKGEVIEIGNKIRLEAHRLIEEFMLAANQAVAKYFTRLGLKLLYRVHDKPDKEKLTAFAYMLSTLGYKFPVSEAVKPMQFSRFLEKIKGKPEEGLINELVLRAMQKAVYQPRNIGHFGLAFKHYTHFTSPIRRYPDLIVHRLVRRINDGRYPVAFDKNILTILGNIGKHCSETERVAESAEREAVKNKQTIYMKQMIGKEFNGVISGILNFGFFVRIENIGAEGMVRLSSLNDDYYSYDEPHFRLVGRRTGNIFRVGDPVRVVVVNVEVARNEIDLSLMAPENKNTSLKKGKRGLNFARKRRRKKR